MIAKALEKGVASVVARWMLEGHADAVLDRVAAAGALPPEELAELRARSRARLERVRDEGAPYAQMLGEVTTAALQRLPLGPVAGAAARIKPSPFRCTR